MIWAKEETMSRKEIEAIQLERLKDTVKRVYEHVPAYRAKMDAAGVKPEDVKSLGDVKNLPFTTKQGHAGQLSLRPVCGAEKRAAADSRFQRNHGQTHGGGLHQHGPGGLEGVRGQAGGGRRGHGRDAWRRFASATACSPAPWACTTAWEKVGAAIVPSSTGNTQKQLMYMKDFESTPAGGHALLRHAHRGGGEGDGDGPPKDLKIHTLLLGSELMTEAMRTELYKVWGYDVNLTQNTE